MKKIVLVTSGDPSGVGPDICLDLADNQFNNDYEVVILGDIELLQGRAKLLKKNINFIELDKYSLINLKNENFYYNKKNNSKNLLVYNIICKNKDCIGILDAANSSYVIEILNTAINFCKEQLSNIIVTAPISKEIINRFGINFSGHTEYLAKEFNISKVVMMLANQFMNIALLTTHIPIKDVSNSVTKDHLNKTIDVILNVFQNQYKILAPKIAVCGLNPHAGENGYIGEEEVKIINPVISDWQKKGYNISGSYSADTIFKKALEFDVILAMYHDQGLPVLKYSDFEGGVNVTLGLPIIRTSVDHGVALSLAGTGIASSKSLINAIKFAISKDFK